jgi:hypothetical protein
MVAFTKSGASYKFYPTSVAAFQASTFSDKYAIALALSKKFQD